MKENRKRFRFNLNNQGYSLLELLVSIIILLLIMVPLMSNFVRSMKLNNSAEKLQDYNTLAANVAENIKSLSMEELLATYTNRLQPNGDGTYSSYSGPSGAQDKYFFGIDGLSDGNMTYDALVTIDAQAYDYKSKSGHGATLMNDYAMPNIIVADNNRNGMFFSNMYQDIGTNEMTEKKDITNPNQKSLDLLALDYFADLADTYADEQFRMNSAVYAAYLQQLRAIQNGEKITPLPVEPQRETSGDSIYANPDYCQTDHITDWTVRTTDIRIDDMEVSSGKFATVIQYQITYQCSWPPGLEINNSITYSIEYKLYDTLLNNVYLFYEMSWFQKNYPAHPDIISVTNNCGKTLNFYVVKQEDASDPSISLKHSGSNGISIYTNLADAKVNLEDASEEVENNVVATSAPENRIFTIKVEIYKHVEGAATQKYRELLGELNSNRPS